MEQVIFKYQLGDDPAVVTLEFPYLPEEYRVGVQRDSVVLWCRHRLDRKQKCRQSFQLVTTGEWFCAPDPTAEPGTVLESKLWIGTAQLGPIGNDYPFVLQVLAGPVCVI
jgi:hypothetical protein